MPGVFNNALLFLVNILFDLYMFILVIRLILVWVHTDYYHPVSQFVITLTQKVVAPLRRVIPNIKNIETATVVLIFVLGLLKFFIISFLIAGMPNFLGLPILAGADFIRLILNTFFYAILIQVILSWVQPFSPMADLLNRITTPVMRPLQRIIPTISGFDLSPIAALIVLQLLIMVLVNPLMILGEGITFGQ